MTNPLYILKKIEKVTHLTNYAPLTALASLDYYIMLILIIFLRLISFSSNMSQKPKYKLIQAKRFLHLF